MKVIILLAVCILSGESKLDSFTGASNSALYSTTVRDKRQAGVCSNEELGRRFDTAVCDPNFGQRVVDFYLGCNDTTNARGVIGSCSRNENERFCFEFGRGQVLSSNYTNPLQSSCPSLNDYSNYECTDTCRAALQSLKSNVGCCLNSHYNISVDLQYNNAGLWSACSVHPPSSCQASTLTVDSGTIRRNCSRAEFTAQYYMQVLCNAQIYQSILDLYTQCERPEPQSTIAVCGLNENNQRCWQFINDPTVVSQCQNYTQGCTRSCQTALNTFKTALGCCVNIYNDNRTNPALWSACGITIPGSCPSTLSSQPTTLSSQPTRSSAPLRLDFPNITVMFILFVLLSIQMYS